MHPAAFDYVQRFATDEPISVVEIGARDVNGTTRVLFPNADWWGIDAQPGPKVDEVADGALWRPLAHVDLVVCTEVFEHTPNWREIVANVVHMLRPGGRAVFTCAGPGRAPHGLHCDDPLQPGYYANIDVDEMTRAMHAAGFTQTHVGQLGEDTQATGVAPLVRYEP